MATAAASPLALNAAIDRIDAMLKDVFVEEKVSRVRKIAGGDYHVDVRLAFIGETVKVRGWTYHDDAKRRAERCRSILLAMIRDCLER